MERSPGHRSFDEDQGKVMHRYGNADTLRMEMGYLNFIAHPTPAILQRPVLRTMEKNINQKVKATMVLTAPERDHCLAGRVDFSLIDRVG